MERSKKHWEKLLSLFGNIKFAVNIFVGYLQIITLIIYLRFFNKCNILLSSEAFRYILIDNLLTIYDCSFLIKYYDYYDVLSMFIDRKLLSRLKLNGLDEYNLIKNHDVVTLLYYLLSCNYSCMLMLLAYRLRFACDVMSIKKV